MTDKDKLFIQLQHEATKTPEIQLIMLPTQYRLYDRITGEIVGFSRSGEWDIKNMLKTYKSYIRDYNNHPQAPTAYTFYLDIPKPYIVYFEVEVVNGKVWANYSFDKNMEGCIYAIQGVKSLYDIIENANKHCIGNNVLLKEAYSDKVLSVDMFNIYNAYINLYN